MPLILTFLSILCLILLIAWLKIDTFISFLLVSIGLGLGYVVIYDLGVYILAYFSVLALLLSLRKNHQA